MALVKCPECGHDVSDKAHSCPNCGYGVREHFEEEKKELVLRLVNILSQKVNREMPTINPTIKETPKSSTPTTNPVNQTKSGGSGCLIPILVLILLYILGSCSDSSDSYKRTQEQRQYIEEQKKEDEAAKTRQELLDAAEDIKNNGY